MPDVVIWLISGTKRIASFRIPAYEVLFSPQSDACGQYCGKVFNMFMKVIWRSYIKHERQCFIGISKQRKESWKYDA